ncbi:hypothetical protein EXN66_Car009945 [Channa argus]|uniref:Uncharacterized protein n=1 Tax=Channa argus TaxID=215402 RepID=A0A6G1PVK8_CHAAH|nr:hypothetical protein EXN66_Car009945 [Channa argus]
MKSRTAQSRRCCSDGNSSVRISVFQRVSDGVYLSLGLGLFYRSSPPPSIPPSSPLSVRTCSRGSGDEAPKCLLPDGLVVRAVRAGLPVLVHRLQQLQSPALCFGCCRKKTHDCVDVRLRASDALEVCVAETNQLKERLVCDLSHSGGAGCSSCCGTDDVWSFTVLCVSKEQMISPLHETKGLWSCLADLQRSPNLFEHAAMQQWVQLGLHLHKSSSNAQICLQQL